jgi:60 kDa SS-A/Ro ribonucleoprotein
LLNKNKPVPQTKPLNEKQVKNDAGGYVFKVDKWTLLERFLIIGTEGGTYYANEKDATKLSAKCVQACLHEDYQRTVKTIADISFAGRAVKVSPALFALAVASSTAKTTFDRIEFKVAFNKVVRNGSHLLEFTSYMDGLRSWGRLIRTVVASWYYGQKDLAYQLAKYQNRSGWTQRDVLRSAHVKPNTQLQESAFAWALGKDEYNQLPLEGTTIRTHTLLNKAKSELEVIGILKTNRNTPWEIVPTQYLNNPNVYQLLVPDMGATALLRNLSRMAAIGLLVSKNAKMCDFVIERLEDGAWLKKNRVHPLSIYTAYKYYEAGVSYASSVMRGETKTWSTVPSVLHALKYAVTNSFNNIEPDDTLSIQFAIDSSGSMTSNLERPGTSLRMPFSAAEVSVVMACALMKKYRNSTITAFDQEIEETGLSYHSSFEEMYAQTCLKHGSGTDLSLPAKWATKNKKKFDAIVMFTDNQTWAGTSHTAQAIAEYRNRVSSNAKQLICATAANEYSAGDDDDLNTLNVVGFDTNLPVVIEQFISGGKNAVTD